MPYLLLVLILFSLSGKAISDTNVTSEDNEIIWPSSQSSTPWSSTATMCSSQGQAHFAFQANMAVSYQFTGTAIYIRILRSNITGIYTVSVDGSPPVLTDGFHPTTICNIQFGQTGLSFSSHRVDVELIAPSPQNRNDSTATYLELDAFIYTTPDNSSLPSPSSSSSSTLSPPPSSASSTSTITPPPAKSKASFKTSEIAGIVVAIAVSLVVIGGIIFTLFRKRNRSRRRLTVLDRDFVFPGQISQSPPIPDSHHTRQTRSQSDMPLMEFVAQSYSDHARASPPLPSPWDKRAPLVLVNGDDAPPMYQAPRVGMRDIKQKR